MELEFFAFRHGETDWNVQTRFQGHSDIELNPNGIRQATELAHKLRPFKIPIIASSDLNRALKTAQIVASISPAKIIISDQLREAHLGQTEGITRDEVIKRFGKDSWERWRSAKPEDMDFGWPGGETKVAQLKRMQNYIHNFVKDNIKTDQHPIGISTHGGVLARLVHSAINSPSEVKIPNCVVYRLKYNFQTRTWIYIEQL